ncbi:hypothetical protein EDB80DRAFT_697269 [Ilyonectria destructans]|nr:hypothetical protein EDB80DRAFT_697269 [Ilyonectria destructans]
MTTMMMMTIWRDFLSLPLPSLLLRRCVVASFRRLVRSYPPPPRARTHTHSDSCDTTHNTTQHRAQTHGRRPRTAIETASRPQCSD